MSLSVEQLATLRADGQYARLYIDFDTPSVVFAAQINETFATTDLVRDFGFDNVISGAYTNILAGMTALIGSIPGADDLGQARVRKAATSSRIYIGVASNVFFANDVYVTVIDERALWRKSFAYTEGVLYADEDIVYNDQHANFSPVAMAGPHRRVWLTGTDITINFSGSASYCIGSSISAYSWAFPGALSSSGATTAAPSATYDAPGRYLVRLTVTAANGKTHTAWRTLRIFDASNMPAVGKVSEMVGSFANGGFSCQVTTYVDAEMVRPGALVTVFARDFYDGVETSVGLVAGAENIVIPGWIAEEGIVSNPQRGSVTFRVETANYWLARMEMQTLDLLNVSGTPADWTQIQGMTLAKAFHHMLFWRTTLMDIVDVHLPLTDTRVIPNLELAGQTAYEQLAEIGRKGFVTPLSDQYNRFFCQVDPQYLDDTARDALPVIMEITKQDRRRGIAFDKRDQTECAQVALSSETIAGTLYSLSPGRIPGIQGRIITLDKVVASSQAESNILAGLHRGKLNNPYPEIPVTLAENNRAISIAPAQYVEISIDAADNPRGEDFSGRAIPREVEYEFEPRTGKMIINLRLEPESFEDLSVDGDPPTEEGIYFPPSPPFPPGPEMPPGPGAEYETGEIPARAIYNLIWNGLYVCKNPNDDPGNIVWESLNTFLGDNTLGQYFYDFVIDRALGIVYAQNNFSREIWVSQASPAGSTIYMSPLARWLSEGALFNAGETYWPITMSCHPLSGDFVVCANPLIVGGNVHFWRGRYPVGIVHVNGSAISATPNNSYAGPRTYTGSCAMLSSADGSWLYSYATSTPRWTNDFITFVDPTVGLSQTHRARYHARAGISSKIFTISPSRLLVSTDGGESMVGGSPYNNIIIDGFISEDGTLAVSLDGNTLLSSGEKGGIAGTYRSLDGGLNWSLIGSSIGSLYDRFRTFVNVSGDVWFASTWRKVYASFDNGATWSKDITGNLETGFGYTATSGPDTGNRRIDPKKLEFFI